MKFYDENIHLFPISEGLTVESLKGHVLKISALYHFNKDLNLVVSLEELFDRTKNFMMHSLRLDGFCFLLMDESCRELKVWKASDNLHNVIQGTVFSPGEDISNIVQETGEAIFVRDSGVEAKSLPGKPLSPVLSVDELYNLLQNDVNRRNHRYRVALKVTNSINCLQSIEIRMNATEWKTCTVRDISKTGFKGEMDVAIMVNSVYKCKVVIEPDVRISNVFSIWIAHTTEIHPSRYLFGVEVIDGDGYWKKLFALLTG